MKDKSVKKNKIDVNSLSNRLGEVVSDYQEALNKKTRELEKTLRASAIDKKPSP